MCLMHYCISADTIFFLSFVATNCGPTSFHIANHHHCSWLVVGREKSGLGSCSAASSGAGTVECHGGTSWQRSLQAAGYQSQCTVGGEKLCPVFTEALLSWVAKTTKRLMSQPAIKMPDAPSCVGVGGIHVTPLTPLHFSLPGMRTCSCIIVAKHCLCVSAQSVLGQVLSQAYIVHAVNAV